VNSEAIFIQFGDGERRQMPQDIRYAALIGGWGGAGCRQQPGESSYHVGGVGLGSSRVAASPRECS
jgi:hypothetical protein